MSVRYLVAESVIAIKNARSKGYDFSTVTVPYSKMVMSVLRQIEKGGYIANVREVVEGKKKNISVDVRFDKNGKSYIRSVDIISKPSVRVYYTKQQLAHLNERNPFGLTIVSTSSGVMTIMDALKLGVGGEAICSVF